MNVVREAESVAGRSFFSFGPSPCLLMGSLPVYLSISPFGVAYLSHLLVECIYLTVGGSV